MHNLPPTRTFFTSDHHFGHQNIIQYQNRPFSSKEEMDDHMIGCWNSVVKSNDWVFHLGDFGYNIDCLNKLHGNIILIAGNHDVKIRNHSRWHRVFDYLEVKIAMKVKHQDVVLSHYPFIEWNKKHYGSINLHGHCHGRLSFKQTNQLDVGVDNLGYTPLSFDKIYTKIQTNNDILTSIAP